MIYPKIIGTGGYLPQNKISNYDLEKRLDTSHEWIVDRTGIENRHIVDATETTVSMGVLAAQRAIDAAGIDPKTIDMVVVATCTPDKVFPSTACLIQAELGIPPCPAFDVQAACSGFIYALSVVQQFVKSGAVKRPLLIGSEVMSRVVDWQDRRVCILFGDGAGAVLFEASSEPGVLATQLGADGHHQDILHLDNQPGAFVHMQGNSVFKLAVNKLDQIASTILSEQNLTVADVDWLVPHQANSRILQATAEKLGLPMERVVITLNNQGNTSGASIPLALDAAIRDGRIKRGHLLLSEAFGGGLTWGTALIRY